MSRKAENTGNRCFDDLLGPAARERDIETKRAYQREWIARRRREFFADKTCNDCGTSDDLELDHLDPAEKADHRIWSWSPQRREAEIAKCVIRCRSCHTARHAAERRIEHSTGGYKRGCRCEVCCAAKRAANERYALRRLEAQPGSAPGISRFAGERVTDSATGPNPGIYQGGRKMDRLMMVTRNDEDAEAAVIETDDPHVLVLVLENGERLAFDRVELAAALVDREAA